MEKPPECSEITKEKNGQHSCSAAVVEPEPDARVATFDLGGQRDDRGPFADPFADEVGVQGARDDQLFVGHLVIVSANAVTPLSCGTPHA